MSLELEEQQRKISRAEFHDPKKHFVRANGWLPVMQRYGHVRRRRIKYLTLCAKEAIDVRYFAQKGHLYRNAERNQYPTLTFIEANPEDYAVIAESLGKVALGVLAKLEDVVLSIAHESHADFVATFPHDVINLDFCGDIVARTDRHPYNTTLRTIAKLIEWQGELGAENWHLFLTFKAQRETASLAARAEIQQVLDSNLADNALLARYGARQQPAALAEDAYDEFLRIGVSKIVAHAASKAGYELELDSSFSYSRHPGHASAYRIVKLVCGFRRAIPVGSIPNQAAEQVMYRASVGRVFDSEATDVDTAIVAVEQATELDLAPVLQELHDRGVVS